MVVAITDYKRVFSEYHNGTTSFIHMLPQPTAASRDAAIHQVDINKFIEAMDTSIKKSI